MPTQTNQPQEFLDTMEHRINDRVNKSYVMVSKTNIALIVSVLILLNVLIISTILMFQQQKTNVNKLKVAKYGVEVGAVIQVTYDESEDGIDILWTDSRLRELYESIE